MNVTKTVIALGAVVVLSGMSLSAMALGLKGAVPFKPDAARGHLTAVKLCTGCHIVDKEQTGTAQPGVPSFIYMANKPGQTEKALANTMIHPFPPMIDTHLTTHEIKDLSVYILSLKSAK